MSDSTCGAKTRAGSPCRLPAGWGTDHVGEGRCKLHGGASPRGVDSPHFKHGARSKYFDPSSIIGFDEWREQIGPALELEEDLLAMMYIARQALLKREPVTVMTGSGPVQIKPGPDYLTRCMERMARAAEKLWQKRDGITIRHEFTDRDMEERLETIGAAIAEHVSDPQEREAVMSAIKAAAKGEQI